MKKEQNQPKQAICTADYEFDYLIMLKVYDPSSGDLLECNHFIIYAEQPLTKDELNNESPHFIELLANKTRLADFCEYTKVFTIKPLFDFNDLKELQETELTDESKKEFEELEKGVSVVIYANN